MLSGKQKRHLRSIAVTTRAIIQIGKDGLSANLVETVDLALEAHELVKISVLKNCDENIKEMALDMAGMTNSEVVQIIGHTIVLFRRSKKRIIEL